MKDTAMRQPATGLRAMPPAAPAGSPADHQQHTVGVAVTVPEPVERTYRAFVDAAQRRQWLPAAGLCERSTITPRSARFDWDNGSTRLHVTFLAKGEERCTVTVQQLRRDSPERAARARELWRDRMDHFAALLAQ